MKLYRKKPIVIEALQWVGQKAEMDNFLKGAKHHYVKYGLLCSIFIETLEGIHEARIGDWIIKGVNGEFYPCKPEIFNQTYEEVTEPKEGDGE